MVSDIVTDGTRQLDFNGTTDLTRIKYYTEVIAKTW